MRRHRLPILAFIVACSLAVAACSVGPVAVGIPVTGSSSAKLGPVEVNHVGLCVGLLSAGHLRVEVDSTAGADPDHVTYQTFGDEGPDAPATMPGPVNHHFEATTLRGYQAGNCPGLIIAVGCLNPCPAWEASSQTFNYRVTVVP
jgi:hypothetical protein